MSDLDRRTLHDTITEVLAEAEDADVVVTGWVLLVEDVRADKSRTLHALTADASGEDMLPEWTEVGFLVNRLLGAAQGWREGEA